MGPIGCFAQRLSKLDSRSGWPDCLTCCFSSAPPGLTYAQTSTRRPQAPTREDRSWGPFSALSDSGLGAEAGRRDLAPANRPTSPGDSCYARTIASDPERPRLARARREGWKGLLIGQREGKWGRGWKVGAATASSSWPGSAGLPLLLPFRDCPIWTVKPASEAGKVRTFGQSRSRSLFFDFGLAPTPPDLS